MNESFLAWLDARIDQTRASVIYAFDQTMDPHRVALEAARLAELALVRAEAYDYDDA